MGGAGGANGYSLYGPSSFSWTSVGESGAFSSGELVLQAGVYNISGGVYASEPTGGPITLLDFAIVPAPGAIALLGVAGLVGRRRRA
jgi:hypothetical protein